MSQPVMRLQRPFPGVSGGSSGKTWVVESPGIDDLGPPRGTVGGRVVLAVREANDHEAEEVARDGPFGAVPGDARSGASRPVVGLAQPLLCV